VEETVVPPDVNSIEGEALRKASVMLATKVVKIPRRTTTSNKHLPIYYSAMLNTTYGIDAQLLVGLYPAPLVKLLPANTITLVFP
jgi:hypothetical protein